MGAIYQIEFPNGKRYVGMTTAADPAKRLREHKYHAKRGTRLPVYDAMRKYPEFEFRVLAIANDRDYLEELERKAISVFGSRVPNGYNLTDGGDGAPVGNQYQLGKKRSEESRAKMSASFRGRVLSAKARANISAALIGNNWNVGKKQSQETKGKRAAAMRGRTFSPETIQKMRVAALAREAVRREQRTADGR